MTITPIPHLRPVTVETRPVDAWVGVGANLGDALYTVRQALADLATLPGTRVIAHSSLYRTAPVGFADQPPFINAVAQVSTMLEAVELLAALHDLEARAGRERPFANAPRTLDLDLLLYGDRVIRTSQLTVPHPRMHERAFVLVPLLEIAPAVIIPGIGAAATLSAVNTPGAVERLSDA